ncbi:MAG TPA: ABC transporter permease [Acidimicrobiia bacterium]|nr:ABC transporter permease [Acidimicrobiia bacterium]
MIERSWDLTVEMVAAADRNETPAWVRTLLSLAGTLVAMAALVWLLGANPLEVVEAIVLGALGNPFNIGQTVVITGILIMTALAAAIPFSARLWNVGGEGQMTVGAVAAAVLGIVLPGTWSSWLLVPVVVMGSMAAGALYGAVPGWLKARFDASEIVTSLMLNFVAASLAAWVIFDVYPEGFVQRTEAIHVNAELPRPIDGSLVDVGIIIAVAVAVIAWFVMKQTRLGFSIRAIGANTSASRLSGIRTERVTVQTFLMAGAFAGLAGSLVVQGRDHSLLQDFSANLGFLGIGVALVARLHPLWIIASASFFAILRVGSNSLQAGAGLSPVVGEIVIATFVILLMVTKVIKFRYPESVDA